MNFEELLESAKKATVDKFKKYVIENGGVKSAGPGHTWAVCKLPVTHLVIELNRYYVNMRAAGEIDAGRGAKLLSMLKNSQITGTGTREDGNFLCYTEETRIQDYNAAFFIVTDLLIFKLFFPDVPSEKEKALIDEMLTNSLTYFSLYCKTPEMYYPNPAISNIMCLYCIASLHKNEAFLDDARQAIYRYLDYTEKRGWGWGEDTSPSYVMEILTPLKIVSLTAQKVGDGDIARRVDALIEDLLKWCSYHGDLDFVPAIRNYNTSGEPENKSGTKLISGITTDVEKSSLSYMRLVLFRDFIERGEENRGKCEELWKNDTYVKHIFDGATCTTWISDDIHLGTISEYPFMPSTFQNPTWGNGWQAMPVAFVVRDEHLAYLRWEVTTGDRRRCFPNEQRLKPNDINASLFNEHCYPDMYTVAKQEKNIAVVIRRINRLHNSCREIVDEFAVPRYKGKPEVISKDGIDWAVLRYKTSTVLIGALSGITLHTDGTAAPQPPCISILGPDRDTELDGVERDGCRAPQKLYVGHFTVAGTGTEFTTLSQIHYKGEERRLDYRALETAWAVIALDHTIGDAGEYLETVKVTQKSEHDFEIPRWHDARIATITLEADGKSVTLRHDPYNRKIMIGE